MKPLNLQNKQGAQMAFFPFLFSLFSSLYSLSVPCWDRALGEGGGSAGHTFA